MALFNTKRIWFFDEKGEYHGKKGFSKHDRLTKYGKGSYNIDIKNASYKEDTPIPFLWKRRTYFSNISNSYLLKLDKKAEPCISPELYNIELETKVARDLNDLAKGSIWSKLNPKVIIAIVVIAALAYYFLSGGKIG